MFNKSSFNKTRFNKKQSLNKNNVLLNSINSIINFISKIPSILFSKNIIIYSAKSSIILNSKQHIISVSSNMPSNKSHILLESHKPSNRCGTTMLHFCDNINIDNFIANLSFGSKINIISNNVDINSNRVKIKYSDNEYVSKDYIRERYIILTNEERELLFREAERILKTRENERFIIFDTKDRIIISSFDERIMELKEAERIIKLKLKEVI